MGKKRLYELARDYSISSDAMVSLVQKLGYKVKSHMSSADDEMQEAIAREFSKEKDAAKKEMEKKKKLQKDLEQKSAEKRREGAKGKLTKAKDAEKTETAEAPEDTKLEQFEKLEDAGGREKIVSKAQALERSAKQITQIRKKRRDRKKKRHRPEVSTAEVKAAVKQTMAKIDTGFGKRKKYRRRDRNDSTVTEEDTNIIQVTEFMSLAELANTIGVKAADLIAKCMELGMMVTINQRLDLNTIETLALEYGLETEEIKEVGFEEEEEEEIREEDLELRAPIVTIMGHVDHGKTSLLDYIRKSNVVAGESGAITQHIGAYQVKTDTGNVTFLDTPGHEAFTAMRARGAQLTDIVVLVVAADDGVMPQTIEAIDHARAAGVPIIVAVNKIDKPEANPDNVKTQLSNRNLVPEEWGGKTIFVDVSAKTGEGIEKLLEMISLQAEVLELKANPHQLAKGAVVEAELDRGRGVVATLIVQQGKLHVAEPLVVGNYHGKVRAMINDRGEPVTEVLPGEPVQITGLSGVPQAGDSLHVVEEESEAREIAAKRQQLRREQDNRVVRRTSLENVYEQIKEGQIRELKIIIKGDVDGSVQALRDTLEKIGNEEVRTHVIHYGVGGISESDVLLAAASDAIIIGFHVRPDARARELAAQEKVDIRLYTIIYEVDSDIRRAIEGLLEPDVEEKVTGLAEVKDTFKVPKFGVVAGSYVQSGTIHKGDQARVIRDSIGIYKGTINSLRRFKDDAREVPAGMECGIKVEGFDDVKVGDLIETFEVIEVARKL